MLEKEKIRNFAILSHIDHGKSTLADRFLELTGTIPKEKMRPQYLDMMDLEREKGITIKMQPVRMIWRPPILDSNLEIRTCLANARQNLDPEGFRNSRFANAGTDLGFAGSEYILNLIDTPGHVDFSYEVSRSMAAVEGAILLVDASKGIQAQTLANLEQAQQQKIKIIPAINKIDLPQARIEATKDDLASLLGIDKNEISLISAKLGTGVEALLTKVIEAVPPPQGEENRSLRALIFDSKYDSYKGVIAFVKIVDGQAKTGDKIFLAASQALGEVREVGFFKPELVSQPQLASGEIGYIATGIKEPGLVRVGDTIMLQASNETPLEGYKEPKPMVFLSVYPENTDDYELLKEALEKFKLTDPAVVFAPEFKEALGRGFRCGFLGSLHAEIVSERLHREFDLDLVISTPSVVYKIITSKDKEIFIKSATDWPETGTFKEAQEPWVKLEVMTPEEYLGSVMEMLSRLRAKYLETKYFGTRTFLLIYEMPLIEIITGFYDNLKSATQGYASLNYELIGFRPAKLVKLEILIAGRKEEAFSMVVPESEAEKEGRRLVSRLKEVLPAQLFSVPLQAAIGGKIIARETIRAKGKDVIAPLYGGDYTRKRKLLEKQKEGKKELKEKGRVRVPPKVFFEVMKK